MHRIERDGLFLRVGPPFDRARFVVPGLRHGFGESAQAANAVWAREIEIEIDVGERPLGAPAMPLQQEGADPQNVDGLRQEIVRRR